MIQTGAHLIDALAHVLLLQQAARLVIDVAGGGGALAGVGVLLPVQDQGAPGHGAVRHILGGGGHLVIDLALGHGIDAVVIGAVDLHRQLALAPLVIALGDDLDGVVGAVFKAEVGGAVVHRGIHARVHIAGVIAVVLPLHDLQVGVEHRIVDGGGHLTGPAAHLVHRGPAGVDGGRQIPLAGRAAAGGIIIREHLAGEQDHPVAGGGGQLYVALSVGGAGHIGGAGAKHVPEQLGLQGGLGHAGLGDGQGDGEGLPLPGGLIGGPQPVHVEVHAHRLRLDLVVLVHGGVLGLGIELPVDGVKVRGLGRDLSGGKLRRLGDGALLPLAQLLRKGQVHGLAHGVHRLGPVHARAGFALGHGQLVAGHLIGGQNHAAARRLVGLLQLGLQRLGHRPVALGQGQVGLAQPQPVGQIGPAPGDGVAPPHRERLLGGGAPVIAQLVGGQGAGPVPVAQLHGDLPAVIRLGGGHGGLDLLPGQAGHVLSRKGHIGEGPGQSPRPHAQPRIGRAQHRRRPRGHDRPGPPALLVLLVPALEPGSGLFFLWHTVSLHRPGRFRRGGFSLSYEKSDENGQTKRYYTTPGVGLQQ